VNVPASPRIRAIIQQASDDLCVPVEETLSKSQEARPFEARARAIRKIRAETKLSLQSIGKIMGGRHHTTILHAIRMTDRYFPMIPMRPSEPEPEPQPEPKFRMIVPRLENLPELKPKTATGPPQRKGPMTLAERLAISERRSVARILYIHGSTYGVKPYARFNVLT
jgi:hypothetical protein